MSLIAQGSGWLMVAADETTVNESLLIKCDRILENHPYGRI